MKLLVDSTFPASAAGPQPHGHHVTRYGGPMVSDADLVALAAREGFDVVVFLGTDSLADPRVHDASERHGIAVAVSSSPEPDEAEIALKANLAALASKTWSSAPLVIRKVGVVSSEIAETAVATDFRRRRSP